MPLHRNTQHAGVESIDPHLTGVQSIKVLAPAVVAQAVRINPEDDTTWQYNNFDGVGWRTCPDQTLFIPDIRVRNVNVVDTSGGIKKITYDLSGTGATSILDNKLSYQTQISEILKTNESWDRHITKLYFGSDNTDAFHILLLG